MANFENKHSMYPKFTVQRVLVCMCSCYGGVGFLMFHPDRVKGAYVGEHCVLQVPWCTGRSGGLPV